jgi:hypothetical protein
MDGCCAGDGAGENRRQRWRWRSPSGRPRRIENLYYQRRLAGGGERKMTLIGLVAWRNIRLGVKCGKMISAGGMSMAVAAKNSAGAALA